MSQSNAASVATYGVEAWFWVWLLDDDVVGPMVQHQVVLEHRDNFRKLPIGMIAISETSAGRENTDVSSFSVILLWDDELPGQCGVAKDRKTWWGSRRDEHTSQVPGRNDNRG